MWSLTPFEQYMVDDDCIGFPMDFTAIWSCEGSVNQAYLQRSLDEALKHHPLLTCRLEGKKVGALGSSRRCPAGGMLSDRYRENGSDVWLCRTPESSTNHSV
jgi:hypothetical protein